MRGARAPISCPEGAISVLRNPGDTVVASERWF